MKSMTLELVEWWQQLPNRKLVVSACGGAALNSVSHRYVISVFAQLSDCSQVLFMNEADSKKHLSFVMDRLRHYKADRGYEPVLCYNAPREASYSTVRPGRVVAEGDVEDWLEDLEFGSEELFSGDERMRQRFQIVRPALTRAIRLSRECSRIVRGLL